MFLIPVLNWKKFHGWRGIRQPDLSLAEQKYNVFKQLYGFYLGM